jgi:hypothetical protein
VTPALRASPATPLATGKFMRSLIIGCLLVAPTVAHAGGYYTLDSGIRAIGRGMAFTAGADDLSAQYYNPAALTRIDRTTLELRGGHRLRRRRVRPRGRLVYAVRPRL